MERVIIIGCGGAGKSTLARAIGEKLDLPVIHLDKLFWLPGWVQVSREEFDRLLAQAVAEPRWIMDGNFNRTIQSRLDHCDTVIYMDFSRRACVWGVIKRIATTYGKVRPDMGDGCPERIDMEFLKWVWNFNRNKRDDYYRMLNGLEGKRVIILKSRRQVRSFLNQLG